MKKIAVLSKGKAELIDAPQPEGEISGKTLFSVVSTGTELGKYMHGFYPYYPGYSATFECNGKYYWCTGSHQSYQAPKKYVEVDDPEKGVFLRFQRMAFDIWRRRCYASSCNGMVLGRGLIAKFLREYVESWNTKGEPIRTVFVCNPNNAELLQACDILPDFKYDDIQSCIVMVGVPWSGEIISSKVLKEIFFKDITVVSGWERITQADPYYINNVPLSEVDIDYDIAKPEDCQQVYQDLLYNRKTLTTVFDWR